MLRQIISRLQAAVLTYPERVLIGSLALLVVALWLGRGVEFRTARSELAPPDDPDEKRLEEIGREFTGSSALIVCAEAAGPAAGSGPGELRTFADALADALRGDPAVASVFYRVDLDWLLEHGLHLAPPAALTAAAAAVRQERGAIAALAGATGVADLNDLLSSRLEGGLAQPPAGLSRPSAGAAGRDAEGARFLAAYLRAEAGFLRDPGAAIAALESAPPLLTLAGGLAGPSAPAHGGYLSTHDGSTLFLLVSPQDSDDSLPALRRFVGAMRARAAAVLAERPGFRVAFTGEPATTVEEMDTVRRDTWFTSLVSGLGVTLLTLLVFRWKAHALLLLATLVLGVAWSFGAVRLELGYLNLITSSFVSTLVGVGIAYGIHPLSEYELEGAHTGDPLAAVREAYHRTGAAVTVAAATTAAAFFAIMLMEFRGFAELGLVAGVGVILCLVASLITLPALILIYGRRRAARHAGATSRTAPAGDAGGGGIDRPEASRGATPASPTAAVDRIWHEHGAGLLCHFPRSTTLLALLLTAACVRGALGSRFDTNFLDLLPQNAESLRYQRRMVLDSDLSPAFNIVVADDLEALRLMRERARAETSIDRFESVLQFLPEDESSARAAVRETGKALADVRLPALTRPAGRDRIAASLARLEAALGRASEAAFGAGLGDLAGPLEEARRQAEETAAAVRAAPPGAEAAWEDGQKRILAWARRAHADLRRAAAAGPPTLADLPPELRQRFLTPNGRFLGFLHPAASVFDAAFLERYVEASRRVSPNAAGFPIVFLNMSRRITSGFYRSVLAGAVLVVLILLIDYRNGRDTLLALVPLLMGMAWMLGGMRLLGLSFNFANLVAVPLIIGVGIDNGVHVVHRLRLEGDKGMIVVLRHTGRAILIAGLTTMIGFGSLALASHRGLASLGLVLLMGVGACVATATVVLPNMLIALGLAKR